MLSDSLNEIRKNIQKELSHYSEEPFGPEYPTCQRRNIILALYHLQLAQMAFDSWKETDNHVWGPKAKKAAKARAIKDFDDAVNGSSTKGTRV